MPSKRTIPSVCSHCGTSFLAFRSSEGRYCSKSCRATAYHGPVSSRLERRISKGPACWLWTGSRGQDGYGRINQSGMVRPVHVVAYELASGEPIP